MAWYMGVDVLRAKSARICAVMASAGSGAAMGGGGGSQSNPGMRDCFAVFLPACSPHLSVSLHLHDSSKSDREYVP